MPRIIMHVDLDYFYAQLEELRNPAYREKPIVVCMYSGRSEDSGAVSASNYVARSYGVKAGIPIAHAKKKLEAVDSLFIKADLAHYRDASVNIMLLLEGFADRFECASIDEAYLDVSEKVTSWENAPAYARNISHELASAFNLTSSIGVGPNKLVAKIASDLHKPNGITIIPPDLLHETLDPLDVHNIPGVGPKTRDILHAQGIYTIGALRVHDPGALVIAFGKSFGSYLIQSGKGEDDAPVQNREGQKQVSRMKTLPEDTYDLATIQTHAQSLALDVLEVLQSQRLSCKGAGIIAVAQDLSIHSKSHVFHSFSPETFTKTISALIELLCADKRLAIRRIGVRAEQLYSTKGQRSLGDF